MNSRVTTPSLRDPRVLVASFFGVGLIPVAPGTFGSLATLPFLWLLFKLSVPPLAILLFILIASYPLGIMIDRLQRDYHTHDPSWVVVDEVLGMALAYNLPFIFMPSTPLTPVLYFTVTFTLFRFYDIVKVFPADKIDRQMKHGMGVILDDLVSGIYAAVTLLLVSLIFFEMKKWPIL
ncbi:MAG: phosphatidylglycerophosphatase A [Pseudomonadota bacterium]